MGLYLCIFDGDEDANGVEVGSYADFNALRDYIAREVEGGNPGSQFPTLILHPDSDGKWSVADCEKLDRELSDIVSAMEQKPAINFSSDWQKAVAKSVGLMPRSAYESFIDVDGELLLERLRELVTDALKRRLPVLFQ